MQGKDVKETTTELVDAARKPLATIKVNAGGLTGQLDFRRAAPVNPKATHYEHEVQAALCRGAWAEVHPAKTPKGELISWSELLRKYVKHVKQPTCE